MITLRFSWPQTELWPNRSNGTHWAKSSSIRATSRLAAKLMTLNEMQESDCGKTRAALRIVFHAPDRRRFDLQNAFSACKSTCDGVADALQIDDSQFNPIKLERGEPRKGGCVIVEVDV